MTPRAKLIRILKILIRLNAILLALSLAHMVLYFQYHQVKLGMNYEEVDRIMAGVQKDDWGVPGGKESLSFYFTHPWNIVIVFDSDERVVRKRIKYF